MLKLVIGFIAFAGLSLYFIAQGGDNVDMGGEKHGTEAHAPSPAPLAK